MRTLLIAMSFLSLGTACDQQGLGGIDPNDPGNEGADPEDIPWEEGSDGREIWDEVYLHEPCIEYIDPTDNLAYQVPGAARFFAGDYNFNAASGTLTGKEYLLLVANPGWNTAGEDDCQVVWSITGALGEGTCAGCDYSMEVSAQINQGESDCPLEFQQYEAAFEESYDVALVADGSVTIRWLESQATFGEGWWTGDRVAWVSDPACYWF